MNIQAMRFLDRWVGIPLCFLLTMFRYVGEALRKKAGARPTETELEKPVILLVKLAEMGSTAIAFPAIKRLQELYPNATFQYLCFQRNCAVLNLFPDLPIEAQTIRTTSVWELITDSFQVIRRLRRMNIDLAIDLEFFSRATAALTYLSGSKKRVGYHGFSMPGVYCGDLYTHRVQFNLHVHTSASFLMLAEASVESSDEKPLLKETILTPSRLPQFEATEEEVQTVLKLLTDSDYPEESRSPILILNVNASDIMPLRRWPRQSFVGLATRCLEEHEDLWIVLTGSSSEVEAVESIQKMINRTRVISLAGKTSLRELLTLFTLSNVLITNDSGPAHFAALTPIHIISLFGPETPKLYQPISPKNCSLSADLACSPCINAFNQRNSACDDNVCMQRITVERVYAEFERALQATAERTIVDTEVV